MKGKGKGKGGDGLELEASVKECGNVGFCFSC